MGEKQYNLTDAEQVRQLGIDLGNAFSEEISPALRSIADPLRATFFCALFSGTVGTMTAAMGPEPAQEVLEQLKTMIQDITAKARAMAH